VGVSSDGTSLERLEPRARRNGRVLGRTREVESHRGIERRLHRCSASSIRLTEWSKVAWDEGVVSRNGDTHRLEPAFARARCLADWFSELGRSHG
jgi:hypothetical protein